MHRRLNMLREFSVPLLAGVVAALVWANLAPENYHQLLHGRLAGMVSLHFLTNDLFMAFFFAIASVEITQSCLPGGDLHPLSRAVNPLLATVGGVVGPVVVYFLANSLFGSPDLVRGWGIPTATDIAFAWLAARFIFGPGHPIIPFLLLLAIADDAIGLVIIALFYSDPTQQVQPLWLLVTAAGMAAAYLLRQRNTRSYWPYLVAGGVPSWLGLYFAHLHPALALVFVVPFLPHHGREDKHLFEEDPADRSTLATFEHEWKVTVDLGLFFFGLVNAGVRFSAAGTATWLVLASLLLGKSLGISLCGLLAQRLGFPLPVGTRGRELLVAAMVAGIGFTVALFVAGEAFVDPGLQGAAKMGAMLSIVAWPLAMAFRRVLRI